MCCRPRYLLARFCHRTSWLLHFDGWIHNRSLVFLGHRHRILSTATMKRFATHSTVDYILSILISASSDRHNSSNQRSCSRVCLDICSTWIYGRHHMSLNTLEMSNLFLINKTKNWIYMITTLRIYYIFYKKYMYTLAYSGCFFKTVDFGIVW